METRISATQSFLLVLILFLIGSFSSAQKAERLPAFEAAQVISAVGPVYPVNSVAQGTVVLEVTVGPSGRVEQVKVIRDIPSLTSEAVKAVRGWSFRPARLEGRPVRTAIPVAFTFDRGLFTPVPRQDFGFRK